MRTCPYFYPFMVLPVHFDTFILINRLDLPVNVSTVQHVHRCTCSSLYCSACPQMYLFITIPVQFISSFFQHNMHNDLSTHLWVPTRRSARKSIYRFTLMLLLCLRTKNYLSPQLLVYLPIYVPVHDPTCSFSYFHSD